MYEKDYLPEDIKEMVNRIKSEMAAKGHDIEVGFGVVGPDGQKHILNEDVGEKKEKKVIKTIPIRKDWRKSYAEYRKIGEDIEKMHDRAIALKRKFWSIVETDLDHYGKMEVDHENLEIKIYED